MYDRARYFTVTGQHLPNTPSTIELRESELRALHAVAWGQDLVELVKAFGLYLGEERNKVLITCPWAEDHSKSKADGLKDAVLFLTDGRVSGSSASTPTAANASCPTC